MKTAFTLIVLLFLALPARGSASGDIFSQEGRDENGMTGIIITVGNSSYAANLCDNETAKEFTARLPMTINMSELNGNEKFHYLPERLPADSEHVGSINSGDLMLFGPDCLVLFYEDFSTSYSYTRLGHIEDASGLATALGSGGIVVTFDKTTTVIDLTVYR